MFNPISPEIKRTILDCIAMLERYYDKVATSNDTIALQGEDREAWLNRYRPELVLDGPHIPDDRFFFPDGSRSNYGIGSDACMTKYDYCSFLYHCYSLILDLSPAKLSSSAILSNITNMMVLDFITMSEKYIEKFRKNPFGPVLSFEGEDMTAWKSRFFPKLVQNGTIADGTFFGSSNNTHIGIGNDGAFTGCELMHLLYGCLRYLHQKGV